MILNVPSRSRFKFNRNRAAVVLALLPLGAGLIYPHVASVLARPHGARMFPDQVQKITRDVGRKIGGDCELLSPPHYLETEVPSENFTKKRHNWQVMTSCGERNVFFLINDLTGGVVEIMDVGPTQKSRRTDLPSVSVDTHAQASDLVFHYLTDAGMLSPGSEVALSPPAKQYDDNDWRITWNVRENSKSPVYTLKAQVRRQDGCIMDVINSRQMTAIADH